MSEHQITIKAVVEPELKPLDKAEVTKYQDELQKINNETPIAELSDDSYFQYVPAAAKNFVDTMRKELISQSSSIEQVMSKAVNGEALSSEIVNGMKQGIGYFSAGMKTLFSASGSFASVIGSIPQSMIAEFDKDFAEMARSASSIINNNAIRLKSNPVSDDTYTRILQKDRAFNAGATAVANKYSIPTDQMSKLIKGIVQVTVPTSMRSDYFADTAGSSFGSIRHLKVNPEYATYKERLPEMYRDIPDAPTLRTRSEIRKDASLKGFLSQEQYKVVQDLAATNPAWEEALRLAGHATRKSYNGSSGKLYMPSAMTKADYAEALGILHRNVLLPALEGAPAFQKSITDTNWWTQKSMANKTSRTPTEAIAAFNALQQIPIMPEYIDISTQTPQYRHRLGSSIGLNSGINIRPDTYQIMSLTLDDFKAGKLLDPKEGAKNIYGDKAVGASTNRMVLRSTYSDLLGMFGHNTYGTGSKTRPDVPPVLQLDLTDRIFKQENGDLVFDKETGIPLPNEETMKLIEQIFTPRKSISYGNGQEYRYPSYNWGNKGYVPTTIHKNGIIDFVEEELYRSKSAEFLNKYGVNIFDNLVSLDDEFTTVKGLSKPIDARNRMHTPSVPFSELGGRMPEKRKTGFVDLESVTGLNGASVFMPGYLPADALTLRSVGFKGAGFTTDFHKLIKDLYGEDVSEFYAPTWNAPDDIKKVFKDQGIEEVRKIYDTPSLAKKYGVSNFNEDFIDVMKYDALIDASMNKTPFYKNRSHTEVQDMFFDVLDSIGGMRGVQTDKGFKSWSDTISKQVSQNLDITDEEWAENDRLWDEYINDLRYNPEKVIDMLFSDENNPLAQRVQKEHGLLWTDQEARTRVRDAITEAEESKRNRKLFSRKDAVNLLALPNPGEIFGKLGTMNKKDVLDQNLMNIMALGYNEDVDRVAVAPWADTASIAGWRYPNNVGEQFTMDNIAEYIALLNRYNMSKNAAWVNMKTIDKMGGGDVDGDTIQAVRNRFVDMVKRTYANRGVKVDENRSAYKQDQDIELEGGARKVQPSDFADMLYRKAASVFRMASDSNAGNALAQGDWSDPEFVEFASRAGADLKAMYDIDTTFAKTGVLSKWSNYARTAKTMGTPFISAFKGLQGAVKEGDYSGIKDFSKVNFPSIYQGSIANYLMSIAQTPYSSETLDEFIRQQESIQGISNIDESNPIEVARRNYLRFNNSLMSKFATGRSQIMSSEDQAELESLKNVWGKLVSDRLDKPGIDDTERNYLRDQLQQVNEQETRLQHNREFGITQDKITRGEGYAPVLRKGRLTSDISTFETAANAEADKVAAEVALSVGENSELLKAQREAVEAERRRGLLREAEAHKYSWSEIHALEKNPTEWYQNYYDPNTKGKREKNWSAVIGDAAHLAWQTYAEKRMANDNDYGTPEEFEKIFNDYILGFTDQATGRKLFPELPVAGNKMFTPEQQRRYTQTLNYVRNLPNSFHDEEFLSAEENVTPDVGSQLTHPEVRLASSGRLDTKTRNKKTGEVTVWDLKPHKLYEQNRLTGTSGLDQPILYAGSMPEGAVQKVGLIGYADPIDNNTRVEELTPEWIANVQQRVAAITQRMQQFALAGGTFDVLKNGGINGSNFFSDVMLGRFDTSGRIVQPVESALNPSTSMPAGYYQFAANSYFGNNPPSGPINPPTNNPPPSGPNNPPQNNANESIPVYQSDKEDLARAFSTRTLIDKELEKMESIRSKLFQKEMYPEGRENNYGIWDMYDFQTSELAYEQTRRRLQLHGASNDEISELAIARQNARQQYEATLRESASNDILHFTESIVDAQLKRNTSQGARGLVDAAKSLDEQYENAVAAYNKLSSVENPTPEDTKALQNAEKLKTALDETKDTYMGQLMSDAQEQMEYSMEQLLVSSKGKGLSKTDRVNKSVAQFEKQREKLLNDLDYLNLNDLIDENEYNDLKEKIGTIKTEDYKKRATAQAEAEDRLSNLQRDISYDRLIQQGDQLKRHATPFARDDFLTRALDRRDSKVSSWKQYKLQTENELEREKINFSTMDPSSEGYQEAANKIKNLEEASAQASSAIETLQNPLSVGAEVAAQFGDAVGKLATRLGRQLFQKALQETKRFVQEYDASMTEIQMITLKSDDEISSLGDNLIQSALDMRVDVSDVTSAASNLYRQGLSDEEVDTRMEDVIKFSKVANIKAEEASKIITTAMQNELVDNSGEAMDALVALGDTAATTASEIAKGMQKSAAAANEAGVSYQELVTLLTIGTSKTQLGGSSVGTALNTLFYRLYKVGEGEDVIDENGNHISSTAVSRALERAGVSVYGEGGKFRGAYDILTELGSKWNTLDDTDQSLILSQLGAGRQRNNVATILQGLAEDNGELAGRYLSTAGGSEGITDKKYEAYMDSLVAKMSEVRTSWDQLVASLNLGDVGGGFLSFVSSTIQGLNKASEATQGWALKLPLLIGGLTALSALLSASNPVFLVLAGLAGAVVAVGQLQQLLSGGTNAGVDLATEANIAYRKESINTAKTNLEKASSIYKSSKDGELSSTDLDAINKLLDSVSTTLSDSFSQAELAALGLTGSFENVSDRLDAYAAALAKKEGQQQSENFEKKFVTDDTEKLTTLLSSDYGKQYTEEQKKFSDYLFNEYADVNGYLSFSNKDTQNGFEQQIRDSFGIGGIVSGSILDIYEDQIKEWIKTGQFIEGYARDESGKYTALPYRNLDDFYNSLQYAPYTDENGALTQAGSNVETLFKLIAGGSSSGYEENVAAQTNYLEGAIKGFYEDRLTQELSSYDFIDKEFASTISSAFVDVIMHSISGAITSSAAGEEVDFPGLISSNAQKYLMDMAGFFTAEDPVKAFQDFVIGSKQNDEDYILANGLENYTQEEQREAIRSLLFPTSPSVSGEPEVSTASSFLSSILAGADAYRTADKNAPGYSADRIYEQLQGINSFEDLINGIQSGQITGMEAFLKQDATDIANWLAGYITEGENGLELTESANDQAWKIFRSKVAGKSANYADAEKASRIEIADAALATLNEYLNADEETTLGTNVTDYEALKGIIGDRYAGILAAGPNSEELLSEQDIAYMQKLIDNYRLGIESTMEDSSTYLAAVQALEAKRTETGRELTAEERAEVLAPYGGEEAFQIMENNFERFKQNSEVEIHIKNLQSLEEAGKLAAGTAENFQKLRQGGTVALEVITKLTTEGYQSGQQAAMLYNGTPMEQAQAAMAYLGMSADQFYADNGAHVQDYIAQAQSYQQQNQTKDASTWWQEFSAAQTGAEQQRIIAAARSAGYVMTEDRLGDANGFKFDQNVLDVNRVSSFAGQEATQKAIDTTVNLLALINDTFGGTATEQRNAEGIANEATRRYLTNRANVAAGAYTWQEGEEEAQRREALRETTIQNLQAQESEGLIKQGTAQLYEQLTSPIAETVEQAKQGLVNQITTFQRESSVFEAMQGLTSEQWALNGAAYAEELGGLLGWSDQEKQFYSKEENFSAVEEIMAKRGEDFSKGLETLLEQMFDFDLSDFEGLENITDTLSALSVEDGNEAAAVLLSVFETLSQIAGLEWDGSKFTTGDSTTASDVTNQYTTEYQRQQADREILSYLNGYVREGMTLNQFGTGLIGAEEGQPFKTVTDYKNFIERTGIGSILGQVGNEGFTAADVNRLRQATPQGSLYRDTNYRTQYNKFNELRNADGTFDMAGLESAMNDEDFSNWISQFTHLQTALDEVRETSSTTGEEFGYLSDEIEHGLLEAEDAFGSKTKDVVSAMDNATGSAQKQNNALKQLRSSMTAVSNNEYYRKQFTEKNVRTGKTSEYLQGLGFTKDQITGGQFDDQIKAAIELDRSADFEALSESLQANFGTVTQEFKDFVADNPIQIDGLQVGVGSGAVTVSTEELLSNFGSALTETQTQLLQEALAMGLQINWQVDWNGDQTTITPVVAGATGSKLSGGGGGGGQSAAQKAINQAKNDASMAEHYVNMAQEVQNQYKYEGNFEGLKQAIDEERQALEAQLGVYINNIQELEDAQAGVKEYSDDWYSLQDAIDDAKESAIKCSNAIAELMEKDISAIQSEYDRPESKETHEMNMLTSQMEQAELNGDSELYESLSEQKKQLISEMQETNDEQIAEYDALIDEYTKQGVDTLALEKERWALEEENEELRTQALQEEQNAIEELASIAQKNASNQTMSDEHEVNMAQTYASVYQKAGDHQNYRNQLQNQITAWQKMVVVQKQLLAAEKARLATIEAGTEEYYKQLAVVYEIEEKIAEYEANIASAELDIEADIVDEMLENYKREVDIYDHIRTLANDRKEMYKNRGSDEAYDIMLEKERGIVQAQLDANKEWEKTLKSQLAQTTYNSDAWWSLYDQILNVEKAISSAEVELENWNRELEKLKIDRWFEDWDRMQTQREHNLKNAQYEQTRLKNWGQYTDYGTVLEYENELRQENIDILKEQIATLEEEITNENLSEADFYRVADAIHKKSEAVRSDTNEIEKNTKALAENRETIRKTQTTLQNMVLQVIKDNKQREEDMLSARIKLEGYVLDAIKARYVEEWDFIKETYNRQKEALNQEKELINERLNLRKQAADEEDQYEQLRALERQYALISADPTRSKESNELSRQIADLRENISWSRASEEAAYATERIEDELQAIEDFLTIGQERLNEMLENANNFATEVNEIMGRSMTEIVAWLQENNEMYKNSLADSQIQMTEAWEQTWKDMMGITDTYWDEIAQITSDKTTFVNWMMENSVDYLNASLEGQMSYIYQWETAYENAARAIVQEIATIEDAYEQLYDTIYNWENPNAAADAAEAEAWDYDYSWADAGTAFQMGSTEDDTAAAAAQQTAEEQTQVVEPEADDDKTGSGGGDGGGSGGTNGHKYKATVQIYKPGEGMKDVTGYGVGNTEEAAKKIALQYANSKIPEGYTDTNLKFEKIYKEGGYVDFTGPAWVDGTPSRPEAFLDADDTEMVRSLLDAFSYVRVESMHPNLDEITNSTGASSIGDIYITLNEAKLESDADYEEVAQKVGRAFTKELTSKGFNLANYSF